MMISVCPLLQPSDNKSISGRVIIIGAVHSDPLSVFHDEVRAGILDFTTRVTVPRLQRLQRLQHSFGQGVS
ncbi:hypothetical protein NQZ68_014348 [Dissostichus eleginoides]|nr:hypothetical protein NQZ68_014348 [Dissostichus eleginoides]